LKNPFKNTNVVLGVTGSIAAYKAVDLASKLTQAGALVDVILTHGAERFLTQLTFSSITQRPVFTEIFDINSDMSIEHVALARRADVVVVAPATAHTIAKMANGMADDMLTTTLLATEAPVVIAPAMDANMSEHPAVRENFETLHRRGVTIVGPAPGRLASGLWGVGRMIEPSDLVGYISAVLGRKSDLAGLTIVVSAGGTIEPIDPVRVITNRSSGKQGYAIAEAARDRGANVKLVTTPTAIPNPASIEIIQIETVDQMRKAILKKCKEADVLIMAAAISDFRPSHISKHKLKKTSSNELSLTLIKTSDFLLEVPKNIIKIGFAAESRDLVKNARGKLLNKNLDLIIANDISTKDSGFGVDSNRVTIIGKNGIMKELPLHTKYEVGHRILDELIEILKQKN
jgi:phosphopantothenoylcysteine decarboxylase/phosphopantothenate--cysteine ligase